MSEKFKLDVPIDLSEKATNNLDLAKKIIHLITAFTTLLTICVVAPIISTERKYEGSGAGGPNYTLFVAIISIAVPIMLVYFPWMYEKHNKFRRGGKFFMKTRTNIIFCTFNTFLWLTAGIAITVHSNHVATCAVNADIQEIYGDPYTSAWATQCNLAKVTSGFTWVTCILWLTTLIITGVNFWREKSIIQQSLKEHRLSKQSKLEERRREQEDEETRGTVKSGRLYEEVQEHEDTPFTDPYPGHSPYQHPSPGHSPYQNPSPGHSPYQPEPYNQKIQLNHQGIPDHGYNTNFIPNYEGGYVSPSFSPMPTPQHMPHPESAYYTDRPNH